MQIINGIAYATQEVETLKVISAKPLDDMIILLTFNNQQERIFDASFLLKMPAFKPLANPQIFQSCQIINGILCWANGDIDISSETLYQNSYKYYQQ